jgi:hypothetical protein
MNDGTASVRRSRLRTWVILFAVLLGLLLAGVAGVWFFLRSDGDLRAFERDATALGINLRPAPITLTEPMRLAHARRISSLVSTINSALPREFHDWSSGRPPTAEFWELHQAISSQAVREVAREIIAFGNEPLVTDPRLGLHTWPWSKLIINRLLVAEGEELDDCLMAQQTLIEMALRDRNGWWRWWQDLNQFCMVIVHRLPDQAERLRPVAKWLDKEALELLQDLPKRTELGLIYDFQVIGSGERLLKERGVSLPAVLQYVLTIEMAVRMERENILRAELDWLQFVKAHPLQPRDWLDEAERQRAALTGSWLTVPTHRQVLYAQQPNSLSGLVATVLHLQVLAAELRGSPWPVDLLDPLGKSLRRWEVGGRLIGAYSVGPDGIDSGGAHGGDITLRLRLEPTTLVP